LADENGAYSRLVQAQKLRERREDENAEENAKAAGSEEDSDTHVKEGIPLGRKGTIQSITSDVVNKRNERAKAEVNENDYGLFYLFKRVGGLHQEGLYRYAIGAFFAMCTLSLWCLVIFPTHREIR
jgi:ATP-binding cassette subfamily B (MDR/TAP) protein 1